MTKEKLPVQKKGKKGGEVSERDRYDVWNEMDKLFNQFRSSFNDLFYRTVPQESTARSDIGVMPPVSDIVDHGDEFEMNVELPGVSKDDINIEVTPYNIEVSAKKGEEQEKKGKNWLRKERSNLSYYRTFDLPDEIKSDDVKAEMNDGILSVTMPKENPTPSYESKKVKVK
ncbi:MAG: Hsp20/alpha crystallin family protein [Candidatus Thermoplasmatota archaeon]|nr:Hsp20/alpha crystallin family protein [Candidatus Thermoplasmatota archaeon]